MFVFAGTATLLTVHKLNAVPTGFTATDDIAISAAFAFGLVAAVSVVASVSGAPLNPAVTVALATVRTFPWSSRAVLGSVVGAALWTYVLAKGDKDAVKAGAPLHSVPAQRAHSGPDGWRSEGGRREGADVAGQARRAGGERP